MIKRGHLLLAMASAMQPGVFAISSWDLVGALPVPEQAVADRLEGADYRWINRGGVDLLGANPGADRTVIDLPRATALYGPLPQQLADPDSFASQIKRMLGARKSARLPEAEVVAVPAVGDPAVVALIMRLPDAGGLAVTALNYGRQPRSITVSVSEVDGGRWNQGQARDIVSGQGTGSVTAGQLSIDLEALSGRTIEVK